MKACKVCGGTAARPFYPNKGIVQCEACGLVYFDGEADPSALYDDGYFEGGEYLDYAGDKAILQLNFVRRVADVLALKPRGRLLEIGCAYGFFLELASKHWEVHGIDVTPGGVRHAREVLGLDARQADFLALPDEPAAYDLICMWDTIEHLTEPVEVIRKAARWLAPGGLLVMTTGDVDSAMSRFRGESWRLIHPPTHLFYFSPKTLGRACTDAGLTVQGVSYPGYSRGLRNMVHGIATLGKPQGHDAAPPPSWGWVPELPVYLNFYDIMQLVAVKPA